MREIILFELPYGTISNNPIISIRGYTSTQTSIEGKGTYAGQIVIPA